MQSESEWAGFFSLLYVFHQWPLGSGTYCNGFQSLKLYFSIFLGLYNLVMRPIVHHIPHLLFCQLLNLHFWTETLWIDDYLLQLNTSRYCESFCRGYWLSDLCFLFCFLVDETTEMVKSLSWHTSKSREKTWWKLYLRLF